MVNKPIFILIGLDQRSQEVAQTVCQGMRLKPHLIVPEAVTGKLRPVDGVLTLLHVLLPGSALIVEGDDARGPARQAGDDEADPRIQLARMPFGLGGNLLRRFPGPGLVHSSAARRSVACRRALEQVSDAVLENSVGGQAYGVFEALGFREPVYFGRGGDGIGDMTVNVGIQFTSIIQLSNERDLPHPVADRRSVANLTLTAVTGFDSEAAGSVRQARKIAVPATGSRRNSLSVAAYATVTGNCERPSSNCRVHTL